MKSTLAKTRHLCGALLLISVAAAITMAAESMPMMSKAEVKALIGKASTSQDHHRLAEYFTHKTEMMDSEAAEHADLAKEFAKNPGVAAMKMRMSGKTAGHCNYFAQDARKAAAEDRAIAAAHEQMAKKRQKVVSKPVGCPSRLCWSRRGTGSQRQPSEERLVAVSSDRRGI